jgi:predicted amidophosphoribosyltransferase
LSNILNILKISRYLPHIVWPSVCPVCGALGADVCGRCLASMAGMTERFCASCGGSFPCAVHAKGISCVAFSHYRGVNRDVVHAMKYSNGRRIAVMMGRLMADAIPRPDVDYLVPVPLHKNSEREYNQAELMARGASEVWGIPVCGVLEWRRESKSQARKPGALRTLPDDAIITRTALLSGKRVFLVDDVLTTGSTMSVVRAAAEGAGASVAGSMVWSRSAS